MRNDDPQATQRVVDELRHLLGLLAETAGQTGTHAARFSESLARLAGALELGDDSRGDRGEGERAPALTLATVVADVIADTGTMRQHLGGLAQRLVVSRREIERLRGEVRQLGETKL